MSLSWSDYLGEFFKVDYYFLILFDFCLVITCSIVSELELLLSVVLILFLAFAFLALYLDLRTFTGSDVDSSSSSEEESSEDEEGDARLYFFFISFFFLLEYSRFFLREDSAAEVYLTGNRSAIELCCYETESCSLFDEKSDELNCETFSFALVCLCITYNLSVRFLLPELSCFLLCVCGLLSCKDGNSMTRLLFLSLKLWFRRSQLSGCRWAVDSIILSRP